MVIVFLSVEAPRCYIVWREVLCGFVVGSPAIFVIEVGSKRNEVILVGYCFPVVLIAQGCILCLAEIVEVATFPPACTYFLILVYVVGIKVEHDRILVAELCRSNISLVVLGRL